MQLTTWQMFLQASLIVKLVLGLLLGCSIFAWAIVIYKCLMLLEAGRESKAFFAAFDAQPDLTHAARTVQGLASSPPGRIFQAAYPARSKGAAFDHLLRRALLDEQEGLQSYLTFLATTGATAPFIGLLGTVWGIMDAFRGIGAAGSTSLAVVAPAIAEALIATAMGLLVAIPAVIAYNALLRWSRKLSLELDQFAESLAKHVREA